MVIAFDLEYKDNVLFVACDVSINDPVKNKITKIVESFGSIDILINNAMM